MSDPVLAPAKVIKQLDHTTWSGVNCAFATCASLVWAASGGKVKVTPEIMRRRSGRFVANPTQHDIDELGPSNLIDQKVGIQHDATRQDFNDQGLRLPRLRMLHTTRPGIVRSYLAHGATVSVCIGYHVINDRRPDASGSATFDKVGKDGHSVRLQGLYHLDGTPVGPNEPWDQPNLTDMVDPLADGRLQGAKHVAKGPQRLPLKVVFEACANVPVDRNGTLLGNGKVLAMVVFPATPIVNAGGGVVDVHPAAPCAAVALERDRALAKLDAIKSILRGLGTASAASASKLSTVAMQAIQEVDDQDEPDTDADDTPVDSGSIGTDAGEPEDPPDADDDQIVVIATHDEEQAHP